MNWTLNAFYLTVHDMNKALIFYRDQIDLEEAWREGDLVMAFLLPETDVQLIIGQSTENSPPVAGPVFAIHSVDELFDREQDRFEFVGEPVDIPPGRLATVRDPSGNYLYFMDMSTSSSYTAE
jgi:predicted enzyme related to lactoylglutathione lyase